MQPPQLEHLKLFIDFSEKCDLSNAGDSSGNENNGVLANFAGDGSEYLISPRYGQVLDFDGTDYVVKTPGFVVSDESVLLLFAPKLDAALTVLFHNSNPGSERTTIAIQNLVIRTQYFDGSNYYRSSDSALELNRYYVLFYTIDQATKTPLLYIDGVNQAANPVVASGLTANDRTVIGAAGSFVLPSTFECKIAGFWDSILSPAEIKEYSEFLLKSLTPKRPQTALILPGTNYEKDLIGHWEVGDDGATVEDSSPEGNDLTWNGTPLLRPATLSSKEIIQSRELTGAITKEYLNRVIGGGDSLDFSGAHTLIARVNFDATVTSGLIGKTTGSAGADYSSLVISAAFGALQFVIGDGVGFEYIQSNPISAAKYYDIACVWDGTTNADNMKMYVNGILVVVGSQNTISSLKSCVGSNFTVGRHPNIDSWYTNGLLPESWVFDRALSQEEIRAVISKRSLIFDWKDGLAGWTQGSATKRYFINADGHLEFVNPNYNGMTYPYSFTDGEIEIKARNKNDDGSILSIIFMINQGGGAEGAVYNGYQLALRRNTIRHFLWHTDNAGGNIFAQDTTTVIDDSEHTWLIRKLGTSFEVYFDGVLILNGIDATYSTSDRFGILGRVGVGWTISSIKVTPM
jgi:hypothetical protein